ncbi:MAG TPA: peptidase [Planctomycetota bacterium]|nr:peptidase [Planctomycetota bacterium]
MTFCLGIRVKDGLVALADTRVTSGNEVIVARKVATFQKERRSVFIMTSGLRSVRDKAITYFDEAFSNADSGLDRLFKVVNLFAGQIRKVAEEDRPALERSGLQFNIHALIGGQCENDAEHRLYMVYPQGNWVEIGEGTAYSIIGASGYGKPVLDRTLKPEDSMRFALKVGFLAFDSTRISAADVDYPIDVVLCTRGSYHLIEHRFEKTDLMEISSWWQERLRQSVNELPRQWMERVFVKLGPEAASIGMETALRPPPPAAPKSQAAATQEGQQQQ